MKNRGIINKISIILAVTLVALALFFTNFSIEMLSFTVATVIFASIEIIRKKRRKLRNVVIQDELTEAIALKSFRNSWLITINIVAMIGLLEFFDLKSIMLNQAVTILVVVMILSFQVSRVLYSRHPAAE